MITPIESDTRATDRPLIDPAHDDFERALFARRIAETLISRRSPDSIVVGLYGRWGEGKSTVLNFIRRAIDEVPDKVAVLNFNPWRFSDENQLLVNFFSALAEVIDKKLHTKGEKAASLFTNYLAPLIPSVSAGPVSMDMGKGLGELSSKIQPDIDALHERIEKLISESGKRIVIILDDIDRLEKRQIQAIFRLVKLTADFKQTAYLLAFDDNMVSRAIGEMFESSMETTAGGRALQAGQSFLEKIIQVPLRLPRARPKALLEFCFSRVNESLTDACIRIDKAEQARFVTAFRDGLLARLTTPRLAVRYANTISFSLPILKGEVNSVDFMLMEAMSIFYPDLYQFVAKHKDDLAGSVEDELRSMFPADTQERNELKKVLIEDALKSYGSIDEHSAALSLLCDLFPRIRTLFFSFNMIFVRNGAEILSAAELTRRQHVAALTHFERYFAYSILNEDVSDREFDTFLTISSTSEQTKAAVDLLKRLGASLFFQKIGHRAQYLVEEQAESLCDTVSIISKSFTPSSDGFFQSADSEVVEASGLLMRLLGRTHAEERFGKVLAIIDERASFDLAAQLRSDLMGYHNSLRKRVRYDGDAEAMFSSAESERLASALATALLSRALREAGDRPLYQSHPAYSCGLMFGVWRQASNRPPVADYVLPFLEQNSEQIHQLLEFCCRDHHDADGQVIRSGITREITNRLISSLGVELYRIARKEIGDEVVAKYPGDMRPIREGVTPEERIRQFIYLYENQAESMGSTDEAERLSVEPSD
jgi:hypothetical protein